MKKSLTVEQLKALEVGDWVYIILKQPINDITDIGGSYYSKLSYLGQVYIDKDSFVCRNRGSATSFSYSDYGDTWVAYKNKELSEES